MRVINLSEVIAYHIITEFIYQWETAMTQIFHIHIIYKSVTPHYPLLKILFQSNVIHDLSKKIII